MVDGAIDPAQLHLAERRLLAALRRHHRREPLRADIRVDTLVAELRAAEPARASAHRGQQPLTLSDANLRSVVDALVASGTLRREGHRVRLPDQAPALDPIMSERVARLLAAMREAGTTPPSVENVAARLGIPAALVDQLRAAGDLVSIGPRIDYPQEAWVDISERLDRLAVTTHLSVRVVRDELGTTRRHAEAILHRRRTERDTRGVE